MAFDYQTCAMKKSALLKSDVNKSATTFLITFLSVANAHGIIHSGQFIEFGTQRTTYINELTVLVELDHVSNTSSLQRGSTRLRNPVKE